MRSHLTQWSDILIDWNPDGGLQWRQVRMPRRLPRGAYFRVAPNGLRWWFPRRDGQKWSTWELALIPVGTGLVHDVKGLTLIGRFRQGAEDSVWVVYGRRIYR